MSESDLHEIERTLGHEIGPEAKGAIHDLYEIPPSLLRDAEQLCAGSRIHCFRLLRYCTSNSLWRWLPEFIDEVIERGIEPQSWRRGGILFPLLSTEDLIKLAVTEILSVLEPEKDEAWLQIMPDREAWQIGETVVGAPAVERSWLRYDWEPSERVRRVMLNGLENITEVDDIVVATRRWIASRLAGSALKFGGIERFTDPAALFEQLFLTRQHPSEDALFAARGVLEESRLLGRTKTEVPGFRGPPEWYR